MDTSSPRLYEGKDYFLFQFSCGDCKGCFSVIEGWKGVMTRIKHHFYFYSFDSCSPKAWGGLSGAIPVTTMNLGLFVQSPRVENWWYMGYGSPVATSKDLKSVDVGANISPVTPLGHQSYKRLELEGGKSKPYLHEGYFYKNVNERKIYNRFTESDWSSNRCFIGWMETVINLLQKWHYQ